MSAASGAQRANDNQCSEFYWELSPRGSLRLKNPLMELTLVLQHSWDPTAGKMLGTQLTQFV